MNSSETPADGVPIAFEDLALQPGEMLHARSALDVVADFLPMGFLGCLKNQTLIVTNPIASGKAVAVPEGTPCYIKGFTGTLQFTFKTKVVKVHAQPYPHLHLDYPKAVNATRLRKDLRTVVNLPATLFNPVSKKETAVTLRDLSVGGGQLVLPGGTGRKDARYVLSFKVRLAEDMEEEVRAEVVVRTVEVLEDKEATQHLLGVQFLDLDKATRLLVMTLVYRQRLRKR
ncbi:MAG: flagellar brake domain-containing protein [Thiobacillus sp.]